jgi:uncharacterized Zn finger protein
VSPPRRDFGSSWWGRAWVDALEGRARLDPNRLPRGRTYARQNRVGTLEVGPGDVQARVQGRRAAPYRVRVRVRPFTEAEWDTVLDALAAKAGHAAALLDGELPPGVLDDLDEAGIELLPGPGELGPSCSCPDWADPCKHAAAVCYLVADAVDEDPFVVFLLRGRDRDAVLTGVRARRQAAGGGWAAPAALEPDEAPPVARAAFAAASAPASTADLWSLDPGAPPDRAGVPAPLATAPPEGVAVRATDLQRLAADAARRAWSLAVGEGDIGLDLDEREDLARWAAGLIGDPDLVDLSARSGVGLRELTRLGLAWQAGGRDGVAVLDGTWDPPEDWLGEGREALRGTGRSVRASHNRLSAGDLQLRLSPAGRWYRFEKVAGHWEPDGPASPEPTDLVAD